MNNNRIYDSGLQLLSDWVTVDDVGGILVRIECLSIDTGAEIITNYSMYNAGVKLGNGISIQSEPGRFELGFMRGDFDDTTEIQGVIQVLGRARFSIGIYSYDATEDVPEWL